MTGRAKCPSCTADVVNVRLDNRAQSLDWPGCDTGDVAVWHTIGDAWVAYFAPVGERVTQPYKRYRRHECGEPVPSITEPRRAADDEHRAAQRADWKAAESRQKAAKRNQSHKRPTAQITGIRINPGR